MSRYKKNGGFSVVKVSVEPQSKCTIDRTSALSTELVHYLQN